VTASHSPQSGNPHGSERRRHARFLASGRLVGTLVSSDLPVRIRDVSAGGFSIETMEPVPTGTDESVRFTAVDDWTGVVDARSLHCRPSVSSSGLPLYVTGFVFANPEQAQGSIATLLEKVTSVRMAGES
jgi:hypothetical protein